MATVLFLHGEIQKNLDKDKLFSFLASKSLKKGPGRLWLHQELNDFYEDIADFILKHLDKTSGIQIYNDGAIRLNLKSNQNDIYSIFKFDNSIDTPRSIFIEDYDFCNNERNIEIRKELCIYCKYS